MSILSQAQLSDSPLVDSITKGVPILDTVEEAGYFDQPHLTRSLKQFIGYTPAQTIRIYRPDCHSIQDLSPGVDYNATVLTASR